MCTCIANSQNIDSFVIACSDFSYSFREGVYVLYGEIDSGAWAFAYAISHPNKKSFFSKTSRFFINELEIQSSELKKSVCYIDEKHNRYIINRSFYNYVNTQVKKHNFKTSTDDLFNLFDVPEEYKNRKIKFLGPNYYKVFLTMKGFIEGKKVFTCSWCGNCEYNLFFLNKLGKVLQDNDSILIIPSSSKNQFEGSFNKLDFENKTGDRSDDTDDTGDGSMS